MMTRLNASILVGMLNIATMASATEGGDCGSVISGSHSEMCFRSPVIYNERTAGQALDLALAWNRNHAAKCGNGFVLVNYGSIDVNVVTLANGSVNGPITEIEVRQNFKCSPW